MTKTPAPRPRGRQPAPGKPAAKLAWQIDPHRNRAELARIGGVHRGTLHRWIVEWEAEDPLTDAAWLRQLRQRIGVVLDRAVRQVIEGLDGEQLDPAKAWGIVQGAMRTAGLDAPDRLVTVQVGEGEVRRFGSGPPLVAGVEVEADE